MSEQAVDNALEIEIDGRKLPAKKGQMIIEVADAAGINIPRFCYHKNLSIAANCRMCLVDVEKAPKPLPACATPVMDGMKVFTQSRRAVDAQRNVMEFLLINHPLDCPICDQGGECELQDVSMGYGRSVSRFSERKRAVKDEDLGSLIATDMTRCIHCTRCVRFLHEVSGTDELGGMGRGETTKIATFISRSVDSEISGNIIDLCPVGALTNKPFRYAARAWELRSVNGVSSHDSVGANLHHHVHRGKIMRVVPRENEQVNGTWLADRDRFAVHGLTHQDRLTSARQRQGEATVDVALDEALDVVIATLRAVPGDQLDMVVSPRATNEELFLIRQLAAQKGGASIDYRLRHRDLRPQPTRRFDLPLAHWSQVDQVLIVGSNLRVEAPLLAAALRQAWRNGAQLHFIGAAEFDMHADYASCTKVKPSALASQLAQGELQAEAVLTAADNALIVTGHLTARDTQAAEVAAAVRVLAQRTGAALCEIADEPNLVGAEQMQLTAFSNRNLADMFGQRSGGVVLLYNVDPLLDTAYGNIAMARLRAADYVVYLGSYLPEHLRDVVSIALPLAEVAETAGSLTNTQGIVQRFEAAGRPPGDAKPGWKLLRVIGHDAGLNGFEYTRIEQVADALSEHIDGLVSPPTEGVTEWVDSQTEALEWLIETPLYSGDAVLRASAPLQSTAHAPIAACRLHPDDAAARSLEAGDRVTVVDASGVSVSLLLELDPRLTPGVAWAQCAQYETAPLSLIGNLTLSAAEST